MKADNTQIKLETAKKMHLKMFTKERLLEKIYEK